ncbi:hypothetical protein GWA97_02625 [Flavobacterium sp. LaA7.5]|nr:hypothetical protein [Flavobacterium salilacus subsp. altitudinum]
MVKQSYLPILLFFLTICYGQQDCLYNNYYHFVAKGREANEKQNYKEAAKYYALAFNEPVFPLGEDLQTALKIADKNNNDELAKLYAVQLAKGGIPLKFFNLYSKHKWYSSFYESFHEYESFYLSNFDSAAKERLLQVRDLDREFNEKYHLWREGNIELTLQELIEGATTVTEAFEQLCKEFGFPTEQSLGYFYFRKKVEEFPVGVILVHTYQRGTLLFYDQLQQFMCNGGLMPELEQTLQTIRGFGDSTGIEQEMRARYKKYRKNVLTD